MNSRLSQLIRTLALAGQNRSLGLGFCLLFCLAISLPAFGQEATIVGTVTDPSGSVVPNVAITITRVETGEARNSITNDTGQYVAPGLGIGHYNVTAKATGFKIEEKKASF